MPGTTLYFTQEVPELGGSITLKDTANEIRQAIRVANANGSSTINVNVSDGRRALVPISLVGPILERDPNA